MHDMALLAVAGLLAGAMNAVAGGGSFVSFPAMIAAGLPPVVANASSTVALFPGTLASTWAYRRAFAQTSGLRVRVLLPISVAGGLVGAALLLATPAHLFDMVIPFLLLLAALTFAFGPRAGLALRRVVRVGPGAMLPVQFVLAIYGGYFGGAVGLMMMATWSLLDEADVKALAAPRTLLVSAANTVAVVCFIVAGIVHWPEALLVGLGALVGGYLGARIGKKLPPILVKYATVLLAAAMTLHFFLRAYS